MIVTATINAMTTATMMRSFRRFSFTNRVYTREALPRTQRECICYELSKPSVIDLSWWADAGSCAEE